MTYEKVIKGNSPKGVDIDSLNLVWQLMDSVLLNQYTETLVLCDKLSSRVKYVNEELVQEHEPEQESKDGVWRTIPQFE